MMIVYLQTARYRSMPECAQHIRVMLTKCEARSLCAMTVLFILVKLREVKGRFVQAVNIHLHI